jgi:hypothetical protein
VHLERAAAHLLLLTGVVLVTAVAWRLRARRAPGVLTAERVAA